MFKFWSMIFWYDSPIDLCFKMFVSVLRNHNSILFICSLFTVNRLAIVYEVVAVITFIYDLYLLITNERDCGHAIVRDIACMFVCSSISHFILWFFPIRHTTTLV